MMSRDTCLAHDPLFQSDRPTTLDWFCPQHLPWKCLFVQGNSPFHEGMWVWFQVRTAAETTMLHPTTIAALGNPTSIRVLDHEVPVHDITKTTEKHIAGLAWHTTHNMLGMNGFNTARFDRTKSIEVGWTPARSLTVEEQLKEIWARVDDLEKRVGEVDRRLAALERAGVEELDHVKLVWKSSVQRSEGKEPEEAEEEMHLWAPGWTQSGNDKKSA
jgi:hypothetical protein